MVSGAPRGDAGRRGHRCRAMGHEAVPRAAPRRVPGGLRRSARRDRHGRDDRHRRDDRHGDVAPRHRAAPPRVCGDAAALRVGAGPVGGDDRRQRRQRLANRGLASAADRAGRDPAPAARRRAAVDGAGGLLPRLRAPGPATGRVRGADRDPAPGGRAARRQDLQALRSGHIRGLRGDEPAGRGRRAARRADRLRRHGGGAQARRPCRGGAGGRAVHAGRSGGGGRAVRRRLPAAQRHEGLRRVSPRRLPGRADALPVTSVSGRPPC